MNESPVKETDYLKTWALFFVCATIGGGLAGAVAGGILGAVLSVAGVPTSTIRFIGSIAGFFVSVPISYLSFRYFVSQLVQKLTAVQQLANGSANAGLGEGRSH